MGNYPSQKKANNVRTPKRNRSCETNLGDQTKEEIIAEKEGNNINTTVCLNENVLESEKAINKAKEAANGKLEINKLNDNCNSTILPDIVNVQPNTNIHSNEHDDSLISSLASTLNNLKIATPKGNNTLILPNSTTFDAHSGFSSDDETFAECQTFIEAVANENDDINRSSQWTNVLSSVNSKNVENLESIVEQTDFDLPQEIVTILNEANTNVTSSVADSTTVTTSDDNDDSDNLITLDPKLLPVATCTHTDTNEQKVDPVVTSSLSQTISTSDLSNEISNFKQVTELKNLCEEIVTSNAKLIPNVDQNTTEEINSSIICCPEKFSDKTDVSAEKNNKENISLNQTIELENKSEDTSTDNQLSIENESSLNVAHNVLNSTYDHSGISLKSYPSSELILNNSGQLNSTFARSPQQLNLTANVPNNNNNKNELNNTFNANQLDGTFEVKVIETGSVYSKKSCSPNIDKMVKKNFEDKSVNEECTTIDNNNEDLNKKIDPPAVQHTENKNKHDKTILNTETQALDKSMNKQQHKVTAKKDMFVDIVADNKENQNEASSRKSRSNEKDFFVENFITDNIDVTFKIPSVPFSVAGKRRSLEHQEFTDEDFQSSHKFILNASDFDFLQSKGNNNPEIDQRNSLLLRFDPLLGYSVPVNNNNNNNSNSSNQANISTQQSVEKQRSLTPTQEEEDLVVQNQQEPHLNSNNVSDDHEPSLNVTTPVGCGLLPKKPAKQVPPVVEDKDSKITNIENIPIHSVQDKKDVKMSVDVIHDIKLENDVKSIDNIDSQTDEKQDYKMAELEKKFKNDALKIEELEKKLKDAEQKEDALLKRITEKDKTIGKMSGVLEAYEKAIAELIAEKEQIIQKYEKQLAEIKSDRDLNYQHLTSLETTFSDLHAKYERSKQTALTLKSNVETLMSEKDKTLENLRLQEQRYEKMKNHALQQLEIANNKLETITKNHSSEVTKLKALLKKEEISRLSINEQLQQKSRENEELMKICDELINGQGS